MKAKVSLQRNQLWGLKIPFLHFNQRRSGEGKSSCLHYIFIFFGNTLCLQISRWKSKFSRGNQLFGLKTSFFHFNQRRLVELKLFPLFNLDFFQSGLFFFSRKFLFVFEISVMKAKVFSQRNQLFGAKNFSFISISGGQKSENCCL